MQCARCTSDAVTPTEQTEAAWNAKWRSLYARRARAITASLRRVFGDGPPDPEDVTQQAFAKLIAAPNRDKIANVDAFLWRTARNIVLNEKRAAKTAARYETDLTATYFSARSDTCDPESVVMAEKTLVAINALLLAMPENRRRAFMLHRVEGLNVSETARRLQLSRSATHKTLVRAFADLDRLLETLEDP
ncbi:MAG: RNA polymerase sigma factor [Pseudomonadota bacterium]